MKLDMISHVVTQEFTVFSQKFVQKRKTSFDCRTRGIAGLRTKKFFQNCKQMQRKLLTGLLNDR